MGWGGKGKVGWARQDGVGRAGQVWGWVGQGRGGVERDKYCMDAWGTQAGWADVGWAGQGTAGWAEVGWAGHGTAGWAEGVGCGRVGRAGVRGTHNVT